MKRRRRKRRPWRRAAFYALAFVGIEEMAWGALGSLQPDGRDRIAVATSVARSEMARWGVRTVGIRGLTRAEVLAVRRRLGLEDLWGLGPTRLNIRFGTTRRIGSGRYDVDARVDARWARGGRMTEGRFEVRIRQGAGTVLSRRPREFHDPAVEYRTAGL